MKKYISIITTTKSKKNAEMISEQVLRAKLSPCVQKISNVNAMFRWNGKIKKQEEIMLVIKTSRSKLKKIKELISDLHEYDIPEIISYDFDIVSEKYKKWFDGE